MQGIVDCGRKKSGQEKRRPANTHHLTIGLRGEPEKTEQKVTERRGRLNSEGKKGAES